MTICCFNIDYNVSDEELDIAEDCKEAIIMPDEVEVEIDEDDEDDMARFKDNPEEYLANQIAWQTGWLVKDFNYEEIG